MHESKSILRNYLKTNSIQSPLGNLSDFTEIGEGGSGLVYGCKIHGSDVVIKFLIDATKQKLTRFISEYINVVQLPQNCFVARQINFGIFNIDSKDYPYILMKRYRNSLAKEYSGNPDYKSFEKIFQFLCSSLSFLHKNGVIHRDLKPENILLDEHNYVLADFGIASFSPEKFNQRAETRKGDRLANYLFSAPEQANGSATPSPTMDIFALGQICQWYVTGTIHRGTTRESICKKFPERKKYDLVIDKCLSNKPEDRFQSISEIDNFLLKFDENAIKRNPFDYMHLFGNVMSSSFPKILNKLYHVENENEINRFLQNLSKVDFKDELWWSDGTASSEFNFVHLNNNIWLMSNYETTIKALWVYFDCSLSNDMAFLHLGAMPRFGIYGNTENYEEVAIVDGKHIISRIEYDNNHAEINGEIVNLSEHNVEIRCRSLKDWYVFIGTSFNCIMQHGADQLIGDFINNMHGFASCETSLHELLRQIRRHKHPEVALWS